MPNEIQLQRLDYTKLVPILDYVIVQRDGDPTKTKGGLILPSTKGGKSIRGTVLAVGPGKSNGGEPVPLQVKKGDRVIFRYYAGRDVSADDDENTVMMAEHEIVAIIPDGAETSE